MEGKGFCKFIYDAGGESGETHASNSKIYVKNKYTLLGNLNKTTILTGVHSEGLLFIQIPTNYHTKKLLFE